MQLPRDYTLCTRKYDAHRSLRTLYSLIDPASTQTKCYIRNTLSSDKLAHSLCVRNTNTFYSRHYSKEVTLYSKYIFLYKDSAQRSIVFIKHIVNCDALLRARQPDSVSRPYKIPRGSMLRRVAQNLIIFVTICTVAMRTSPIWSIGSKMANKKHILSLMVYVTLFCGAAFLFSFIMGGRGAGCG